MELLDLDDFDVSILHYAAAALDAEARFERELALRLSLHGLEWRSVRERSRDKHTWANHLRDMCSRARRSRYSAQVPSERQSA